MVGRTRLFQRTGSPLIQGSTRHRSLWPAAAILIAVLAIATLVWYYLAYLR